MLNEAIMIEEYLQFGSKPCVFFSGGIDSLLVLSMVRKFRPDISVVTFRDSMPKHQWKIIENVVKEWDLQVLSFPPSHAYFIPNKDKISYVTEYSLNGCPLPLIRDIIPGPGCSLEFDRRRLPVMTFDYDVIFIGTRKEDEHSALGKPISQPVTVIGPLTFVAPIFELSKEGVRDGAKDLLFSQEFYIEGDETYDTGNLPACSSCLEEGEGQVFCPKRGEHIPRIEWDRAAMLSSFQEKFNFEVNHAN